MKQIHEAVKALERILAAILDFVEEAEQHKKNYRENFPGPICILQIFRNNPSRGVYLYYQILMIAKMNKTKISDKILKRKKIKVFITESHQKLIRTCLSF